MHRTRVLLRVSVFSFLVSSAALRSHQCGTNEAEKVPIVLTTFPDHMQKTPMENQILKNKEKRL